MKILEISVLGKHIIFLKIFIIEKSRPADFPLLVFNYLSDVFVLKFWMFNIKLKNLNDIQIF